MEFKSFKYKSSDRLSIRQITNFNNKNIKDISSKKRHIQFGISGKYLITYNYDEYIDNISHTDLRDLQLYTLDEGILFCKDTLDYYRFMLKKNQYGPGTIRSIKNKLFKKERG